jgi:hypothetical protein
MAYAELPYAAATIDGQLAISIAGCIGLMKVFMTVHDIQPGTRVRLYFNSARRSMVIEFTYDEAKTVSDCFHERPWRIHQRQEVLSTSES